MRLSAVLPVAVACSVAAQDINVTQVEEVNQITRQGELAYGATNLAFGYSAGADTLGGGFNAGIPGESEGSLGGGWTLTGQNLTFGFGGVYNNVSVNIAIFGDRTTGTVTVQVNGKDVAL